MDGAAKFGGMITWLGGFPAVYYLYSAVNADGYPEMGGAAALAMAFVVIPYCLTKIGWMMEVQATLLRISVTTSPLIDDDDY